MTDRNRDRQRQRQTETQKHTQIVARVLYIQVCLSRYEQRETFLEQYGTTAPYVSCTTQAAQPLPRSSDLVELITRVHSQAQTRPQPPCRMQGDQGGQNIRSISAYCDHHRVLHVMSCLLLLLLCSMVFSSLGSADQCLLCEIARQTLDTCSCGIDYFAQLSHIKFRSLEIFTTTSISPSPPISPSLSLLLSPFLTLSPYLPHTHALSSHPSLTFSLHSLPLNSQTLHTMFILYFNGLSVPLIRPTSRQ